MNDFNRQYAKGASASIMKTLREIEYILRGEKLDPAGSKRTKLRKRLKKVLIRSSELWYRKGFNRGHKESFRIWKETGQVPTKLEKQIEREFIPGTNKTVDLYSISPSVRKKKSK